VQHELVKFKVKEMVFIKIAMFEMQKKLKKKNYKN
jgi:hypothetical protein